MRFFPLRLKVNQASLHPPFEFAFAAYLRRRSACDGSGARDHRRRSPSARASICVRSDLIEGHVRSNGLSRPLFGASQHCVDRNLEMLPVQRNYLALRKARIARHIASYAREVEYSHHRFDIAVASDEIM